MLDHSGCCRGSERSKEIALLSRRPKYGSVGETKILLAIVFLLVFGKSNWISAQNATTHASQLRSDGSSSSIKGLLPPPPPPSFQGITHTSWTRRDGAPGSVNALAQTKDGYLWIGSSLGLYRFDGLRFAQYPLGPNTTALPSLDVCSLAADVEGGLWIAMCSAKIVHLKADESTVVYGGEEGVPTGALDKIFSFPDGSVWVAGSSKLLRFEGDRWLDFGKDHGIGPFGVFSVLFDREGNIWVARDKRLSIVRKGKGQLEDVPNQVHYVSSMVQTRDGAIWISDAWRSVRSLADASPDGVLKLQGKAQMLLDSHDNLWIAQDDEGLSRVLHISDHASNPVVEQAPKGDLTAPQTHALLEDREGNIWVGTERGLDRFRETPFVHFRSTELRYFPSLIAADDGSIWIDSHGSALMHVQNGVTTPVGLPVHSGPFIKRRNGDICFIDLISYELQCYGRDRQTHTKMPDKFWRTPPLSVVEDVDQSLLISLQGGGFWRYDEKNWDRMDSPGLPKSSPWTMLSDSHGRLWLGYGNDSIVLKDRGVFRTLHIDEGPWSNTLTFYETADTIWAAGSNGLSYLQGDRFRRVHSLEANILQGTSGVAKDQLGNIWLNAGAGVLRIPSEEVAHLLKDPNHRVKIDVFDEDDGLVGQPTQFKRGPSAIADTSGRLWFSTGGDVVSVDPRQLGFARVLPSVLIEAVLTDGKPALRAPGQPGSVLHTDSKKLHDLEISFIGINLSAPERVYYRYQLIGEDKDWQEVGKRRQAFYTRLNPGVYHFQVSASSGGDWSDLASPLEIDVRPAFYQTAWFKTLCVISALLAAWIIFRARMRFVAEQIHSRLSERVAERERVARELHDTLLQGFQGLMMRFHLATQSIAPTEPGRSEMEDALDSADLLLAESRDRIRDLRYEVIDSPSLSDALISLGEDFASPHTWTLKIHTRGAEVELNPITYQDIYAVAREALLNAFRHSQASEIRVEIWFEATRLIVNIADNGKGIETETLSGSRPTGHWGLAGMRERADNLGGTLKITALPGGGTQVSLAIPAPMAFCRSKQTSMIGILYRGLLRRLRDTA
jgi:signal transduction histidine kinase/ligand-binding sensor domain-containing protein